MDGLRFIILSETPCAEPHAGCCGGWRLDTSGYPIKLNKEVTIIKKGFLRGRCKHSLARIPLAYSVKKNSSKLILVVAGHQYPIFFIAALDAQGNALNIKYKNPFIRPVNGYFSRETQRAKEETGYTVTHVYMIQKELSFEKTNQSVLGKGRKFNIDVVTDSKTLDSDSYHIDYTIDSSKFLSIQVI